MSAVNSTMLPLGTPAPAFRLRNVSDEWVSLDDARGEKATVVAFICNHCPYVINLRGKLAELAREYRDQGVAFIAISANDVRNYPDDAPSKMAEVARQEGFIFPYLYDETQEVAIAYRAACTPDFFVFDDNLKLTYRGQFDDSRPGNDVAPTGNDLRMAIDKTLAGEEIPDEEQKPSIGCNIKWKPGNAPDYFNA